MDASGGSRGRAPHDLLALVDGTLIDGNGGEPIERSVILIQGERIVAVGERSSVPLPAEAQIVSAAGQYLIPGLMDANIHLVLDYWPLTLVRYEGRYDELAIESAQVSLKNGVTTVFDTWGPRAYLVKARDAIDSGCAIGSRIYLAGNIVGLGGPFSDDFLPRGTLLDDFPNQVNAIWQENVGPELLWMAPEQVRKELRAYLQRRVDFLKFAVTTHRGEMQHLMFSPRVQQVIVEEAHRAGLTAQTHTTTNEALVMAIELGVDLMQHVDLTYGPEPIPRETLDLMLNRGTPGGLLPQTEKALAWYRGNARQTPFLERYETMDRNARALIEGGATLLLTTDAGLFCCNTLNSTSWRSWVPPEEDLLTLGEGHFNWLLAVEQKGMQPMAALMAATRNIARAYKVDASLGTLETGKIADLLILDKNPLESAAHYRCIDRIMKAGRLVDRDVLPTRRWLTGHATDRATPT